VSKELAFRAISGVGRAMPHAARRFVLDRLGLGRFFGAIAAGQSATARLGRHTISYNPVLHGSMVRGGEVVYEEDIAEAVLRETASGGVFYDVGANIGVFCVLAAEHAEVFAFEPEENNLTYLHRNLPSERVFGVAIGAADGQATFDRHGGAFSGRLASDGEQPGRRSVAVTVRSIDSLSRELPPPTLLKIDVEGGEGAVLEGAVQTLRTHRPVVICELHAFTEGPESARRILQEAGYQLQPIGEKHLIGTCPGRHAAT